MKLRKFLLISIFFSCLTSVIYSAEEVNYQPFELDKLLHEISEPGEPKITDEYIIFTADKKYANVGIAFSHENYKKVHSFSVFSRNNEDNIKSRQFLFYCYKREHKLTELNYRLVIDGIWTSDPLNSNTYYDDNMNLYFSKVEDARSIIVRTAPINSEYVRFIYKGQSNLKLYLSGTFTSWDPWIYQMKETQPGLYEFELPLPSGKYYYNYYEGLKPLTDNTNLDKVYTADGRTFSVLVVP